MRGQGATERRRDASETLCCAAGRCAEEGDVLEIELENKIDVWLGCGKTGPQLQQRGDETESVERKQVGNRTAAVAAEAGNTRGGKRKG